MKYRLLGTLMASAFLIACGSSPEKTETQAVAAPVASCLFADGSGSAAPDWVCGAPMPGYDLSAVGRMKFNMRTGL
ncbi:MAG: hypothetical protein ACPGUE_14255, partial [Marinomonas sp.]